MTKFEAARAAHNATKAKWQRARELAQQHLEERKQMHELRRSSRASTAESLREEGEVQDREDLEKLQEVERVNPIDSVALSEFKPPERRRGSNCSVSTRDSAQSDEHHRLMEHIGDSRRYLWKFGYFRDTQPELTIHVAEHNSSRSWIPTTESHDLYDLQCKLKSTFSRGERVAEWTCTRSLSELRSKLHDFIKKELGNDYRKHFQDTRFAHHGGLPGTTKRLESWFKTLANVANEGNLKNDLLALLLDHLEAPVPQSTVAQLEELRNDFQMEKLPPVQEPEEPVEDHVEQVHQKESGVRHIESEHLVVAL